MASREHCLARASGRRAGGHGALPNSLEARGHQHSAAQQLLAARARRQRRAPDAHLVPGWRDPQLSPRCCPNGEPKRPDECWERGLAPPAAQPAPLPGAERGALVGSCHQDTANERARRSLWAEAVRAWRRSSGWATAGAWPVIFSFAGWRVEASRRHDERVQPGGRLACNERDVHGIGRRAA